MTLEKQQCHSHNKFHSYSECNVTFMWLWFWYQFSIQTCHLNNYEIYYVTRLIVREIFDTTTTLNQWQSHPFGYSPSVSNSKAANSITSTIFIPGTSNAIFINFFTIIKSINFYKFLSIFILLFYLLIIIFHIIQMLNFLCL